MYENSVVDNRRIQLKNSYGAVGAMEEFKVVDPGSKTEFSDKEILEQKQSACGGVHWGVYFAGFSVDIALISNGSMAVWTSSVIPKLLNNTEENPLGHVISTTEESVLASIPSVTNIIGIFLFMRFPDLIGRKNTMAMSSLGMLLSLILIAFSSSVYIYIIGLAVFSLFRAASFIAAPNYCREISDNSNRGKLSVFYASTVPLGNLYGFLVGPINTVMTFTLLCGLPQVIHLLLWYFIPESPMYYTLKNNKTAAIKSITTLRRNNTAPRELEDIYMDMENEVEKRKNMPKRGFIDLFKTKASRRALFICCAAIGGAELSGISCFLAFAGPMFNQAGTVVSGATVGIIIGSVKLCSYMMCSFIVDKLGRRILMLSSSLMCGTVLLIFGIYFYLQQHAPDAAAEVNWLPIACIVLYIIFYSMGFGSVTYALINELFPTDLTSPAIAICVTAMGATMFLVTFTYPYIAEYMGVYYALWFYSFCCFGNFLFFFTNLFETTGKSFKEIQEILRK